jgi:O-antigen/teichoic acid export membrane protein
LSATFRANVIANTAGAAVMALVPILVLPWYLRLLGPEQWGLLAFLTSMLVILAAVDAGLGQAVIREFAHYKDDPGHAPGHLGILLYGLERIYWSFSIVAALIIAVMAEWLALHWLKLGDLSRGVGQYALLASAVLFAVQFPGSVYRSVLNGTQAQVALNIVLVSATLLKHFGGILILLFFPTLQVFLVWLILVSLLETLVRRGLAWKVLGVSRSELFWDYLAMRKVLMPALGLSVVVLLGILAVHIDKLILSRILPIDQFGYYAIASTVAVGILQAIYPILNAGFPRIVQLGNDARLLFVFNMKLVMVIFSLVVFGGLVFTAFGRQILAVWLRDSRVEAIVYPPLVVLLLGTAMNAMYSVGYMNWLARGQNRIILLVNGLGLLLALLLIPYMVGRYGLTGAASGWLAINLMGVLFCIGGLLQSRTGIRSIFSQIKQSRDITQ